MKLMSREGVAVWHCGGENEHYSLQLAAMQGCEESCWSLLYFYIRPVCERVCVCICVMNGCFPSAPSASLFFTFSHFLSSSCAASRSLARIPPCSILSPLSHLAFHLSVFSVLVCFPRAFTLPPFLSVSSHLSSALMKLFAFNASPLPSEIVPTVPISPLLICLSPPHACSPFLHYLCLCSTTFATPPIPSRLLFPGPTGVLISRWPLD